MAATGRLRSVLIDAQSADEYTSQALDVSDFGSLSLVIQPNGTTSGGVVTLEEADWKDGDAPYAGTWSEIATFTAATDFTTGGQMIYHFPYPDLAYHWIRARISTVISGGGTVTVVLLGRADV